VLRGCEAGGLMARRSRAGMGRGHNVSVRPPALCWLLGITERLGATLWDGAAAVGP